MIALVALLFGAGCSNGPEKNDTLQIGAILPMSGPSTKLGIPKKNAMDIAVAEINMSKEILSKKIEIIYEDSKGTPKDGVAAFQKLLSTTVMKYYYIDLTPIVNSCAPIIDQKEVLTFAGSAQPEVTELSPWLFRVFAGGEQEIDMMNDYLLDNAIKTIYILHTNETYGQTASSYLKKIFESNGGKVLGSDEYALTTKDVKNILIKAKNSNPDRIIVLGYGVVFPTILKQMNELRIPNTQCVMNLGATNATVVALDSSYTNDIVFVGPRFTYLMENDSMTKEMKNFVSSYKEKHNEVPDFRAAYAYDVIKILSDVWKNVDPANVEQVAMSIRKIQNYNGASGIISFKDNGDSMTDLVLAQYKNGRMSLLNIEE